jgi:hypothetical protein
MDRRLFILCLFLNCLPFIHETLGQQLLSVPQRITGPAIEDFILDELQQRKIVVIPECLSHDSYDAIQLPLKLIQRWLANDHQIKELVVGLEHETPEKELDLIRSNLYYTVERFATICPEGWGLFSTRQLNEYLFYSKVMDRASDRFRIFGYENSYHFYDTERKKYLLPSQVDTVTDKLEKIPYLQSTAPMVVKYAYSRFFRDNLSFKTVHEEIEKHPDACFIIITGNAHTLKKWTFNETDLQILDAYKIDTSQYARTLGSYLKESYQPLFVQSRVDTGVNTPTLVRYNPHGSDSALYKSFFADYYYAMPSTDSTNIEEPPLLAVPSASNLSLLAKKNFQFYPNEEFTKVAQSLLYLFTGIIPEVKEDSPGQTGSCTFINPTTQMPLDLATYADSTLRWYRDGTFIRRVKRAPSEYNHRSLYRGIFRMMKKKQFDSLSVSEEAQLRDYLLAALSVIGTVEEQYLARQLLSEESDRTRDYYFYFKKFYSNRYE